MLNSLAENSFSFTKNEDRQISSADNSRISCVTDYDQNNQKSVSKSLRKITFQSNEHKINPKIRIIHRIAHKLSMKIRKQYYVFFVILQTMQKKGKNIKDFENKLQINCNKSIKKQNQINKIGSIKISQIYDIIFGKIFEKTLKHICFEKIAIIAIKNNKLRKILHIIKKITQQNIKRQFWFRLITKQKKSMKVDILLSSINNIISRQTQSIVIVRKLKKIAFIRIKTATKQFKKISTQKLFLGDRIKKQVTRQKKQVVRQKTNQRQHRTSIRKNIQNMEIIISNQSLMPRNPLICSSINQDSLIRSQRETCSFQSKQIISKLCKRLNPDKITQQIEDLCNINNVFIDDQFHVFNINKKQHNICQSTVSSYQHGNLMSQRVGESFTKVNTIISNLRNESQNQIRMNNQQSCIKYLNSNQSIDNYISQSISTSIDRNQRIFGNDAVNFKNSLVEERQSMKSGIIDKSYDKHPFIKCNKAFIGKVYEEPTSYKPKFECKNKSASFDNSSNIFYNTNMVRDEDEYNPMRKKYTNGSIIKPVCQRPMKQSLGCQASKRMNYQSMILREDGEFLKKNEKSQKNVGYIRLGSFGK